MCKASWYLRELIHLQGENTMKYSTTWHVILNIFSNIDGIEDLILI